MVGDVKRVPSQQLQTDFESMSRTEKLSRDKLPRGFVLCTAEMEVPIWVCLNSHTLVASNRSGTLLCVSRGMVGGMVNISLFCISSGRGELFHCGAGFDDYLGYSGSCATTCILSPMSKCSLMACI